MLTTFNEVDLTGRERLRAKYKDSSRRNTA